MLSSTIVLHRKHGLVELSCSEHCASFLCSETIQLSAAGGSGVPCAVKTGIQRRLGDLGLSRKRAAAGEGWSAAGRPRASFIFDARAETSGDTRQRPLLGFSSLFSCSSSLFTPPLTSQSFSCCFFFFSLPLIPLPTPPILTCQTWPFTLFARLLLLQLLQITSREERSVCGECVFLHINTHTHTHTHAHTHSHTHMRTHKAAFY